MLYPQSCHLEEGAENSEAEEEAEVSFEVGGIRRSWRKGTGDPDFGHPLFLTKCKQIKAGLTLCFVMLGTLQLPSQFMHQTVIAQSTRGGDEGSSGTVLRAGIGEHRQGARAGEAREAQGAMREVQVAQVRLLTQPGGAVCQEGFSEEGMSEQDERS